ncbi:hypothetical protein PHLGIDRAFT_126266 [Phlebiopsis gigantea 11061_1 CR5-6]|uniref:Uncharacterized protein n=1 Tax=Phlebiopsis gigantea (strain 11061_1 CR5-6) TaxID=745531 RepID=A0A0C3PQT3_PHLG1|nr:hypothetical protein PHLGIDRAFT_126266 [Phlebiopsis gigantea 11061_1 CR5-6]
MPKRARVDDNASGNEPTVSAPFTVVPSLNKMNKQCLGSLFIFLKSCSETIIQASNVSPVELKDVPAFEAVGDDNQKYAPLLEEIERLNEIIATLREDNVALKAELCEHAATGTATSKSTLLASNTWDAAFCIPEYSSSPALATPDCGMDPQTFDWSAVKNLDFPSFTAPPSYPAQLDPSVAAWFPQSSCGGDGGFLASMPN